MKYSCNINSVLCSAYTVSSLVKFLSDYNLCSILCHLLYVLDSGSLFLLVFFGILFIKRKLLELAYRWADFADFCLGTPVPRPRDGVILPYVCL